MKNFQVAMSVYYIYRAIAFNKRNLLSSLGFFVGDQVFQDFTSIVSVWVN